MNSEKNSGSDGEVLVRVDGVSKKFCRSLKKSLWYGLCDIGAELNPMSRKAEPEPKAETGLSQKLKFGNSETGSLSAFQNVSVSEFSPAVARDEDLRDGEFYAVRDVSFELRRGECLGLIGHNGAGKTTLLKMLNGLIKPDAGTITMRGRVGALIALGAGFNPILTGRENIYINGSVLGLSKKEIDEKIDEIIDFAEIGEFIDMPVQNYSSGMTVRLGFAVATALDPDVLILDEVLAVGDGAFRQKCYQKIDSLRSKAAIIFVSHNMPDVARIAQSALVMRSGESFFQGATLDGVGVYESLISENGLCLDAATALHPPLTSFSVEIPALARFNAPLDFSIAVNSEKALPEIGLSVEFVNRSGAYVAASTSNSQDFGVRLDAGFNSWRCQLRHVPLKAGVYQLIFHLIDGEGRFLATDSKTHSIAVEGGRRGITSDCQLEVASWQKLD